MRELYDLFALGLRLLAMIAGIAVVWKRDIRAIPVERIAIASTLILALNLLQNFAVMGIDFGYFRSVGVDVRAGLDPYSDARFAVHPFLNPPTALPLFASFTLLPGRLGLLVWTALNIAALGALPVLGRRLLKSNAVEVDLPDRVLLGLTAALLSSDASLMGLYTGQLAVFTALVLIVALLAQKNGRPIVAGVCLALATAKVSTMLPFLLLFRRRADLLTWAALAVTTVGLCIATGQPSRLPAELETLVSRIDDLGQAGKVNDYSFAGPQNMNIVGIDHTLFRVGLRDRATIRLVQAAILAALGSWVTWLVLSGRLSPPASSSLVALFAMLFLYHRNYDLVLLVLPLVYCAGRARLASGRSRAWLGLAASAILLALFSPLDLLESLTKQAPGWGIAGRLIQAFALPYMTWMIVLAMIALVMGSRPALKSS